MVVPASVGHGHGPVADVGCDNGAGYDAANEGHRIEAVTTLPSVAGRSAHC